jgi:hypothetical protein
MAPKSAVVLSLSQKRKPCKTTIIQPAMEEPPTRNASNGFGRPIIISSLIPDSSISRVLKEEKWSTLDDDAFGPDASAVHLFNGLDLK